MRIRWTSRGADQFEARIASIEKDRPLAAAAWVQRVEKALDQLTRFPLSGHRLADFPDEPARELMVPPCRIVYRVDGDRALILSIKHAREALVLEDLRPDYP
jgi:toxin ParE1/3/4